jgi:hypothetical protein
MTFVKIEKKLYINITDNKQFKFEMKTVIYSKMEKISLLNSLILDLESYLSDNT